MSDVGRPRIALASCAEYPEGVGGENLLAAALVERGTCPVWAVWDDPKVDWSVFDLVVVRATWDYPDHLDAFREWVRQPAVATRLVNPPNLVLANLHKGYLADMGDVAVPTIVVPAGMTIGLGLLRWPSVVVKPAVGLGGSGVVRGATQADLEALTLAQPGAVDAIVQPYLASGEAAGEVSVVCIEGEPTHVVHKRPVAGELRRDDPGAISAELADPDPGDLAAARTALGTQRSVPVYARVDLIHDGGRARVSELELVEPYLWFELAPTAAERLADALVRRARHR
jgi:glutathione synthase/RimK-type ligase-like ATP-grasp enzyme